MTKITDKMIVAGLQTWKKVHDDGLTPRDQITAIYEAMEAARTAPAREPGFYWITQPSMPAAQVAEWRDDGYWYLTGTATAWPDNDVTVIERAAAPDDSWLCVDDTGPIQSIKIINRSDSGWIDHDGSGVPSRALHSTECRVRLRDGTEGPAGNMYGLWRWDTLNSTNDIIAYRAS